MEFNWKAFAEKETGKLVYEVQLNNTQYLFKTEQDDGKWMYWSDKLSLGRFEKFYKPVGGENVEISKVRY